MLEMLNAQSTADMAGFCTILHFDDTGLQIEVQIEDSADLDGSSALRQRQRDPSALQPRPRHLPSTLAACSAAL